MKKKHQLWQWLSLSCLGPAITIPAMAQSNASAAEEQQSGIIQEVVVLGAKRKFAPADSSAATKINMDIIDTPQALSVISSELASIVGVRTGAQAALLTPGMNNVEGDIQVWDDTVARGFGVDPFNSNKINGMAYQRVYAPDLGIVERLEAVRGPAAIIYGQSDYGATINLQLKTPQASRQVAGELGFDADGGYRALLDVTGAVSTDERLRARLITIYDDTRSPQDYAFSQSSTFAPSVSWDITDHLTFDLNYFHGERKFRRSYGFGLAQDPVTGELSLPNVSRNAFIGAEFGRGESFVDFTIGKLTYTFDNGWTLTASGSRHHTYLNWYEPYADGFVPPSGNVPVYDFEQISDTYDKTADLTLIGDFDAFGNSHTFMINALARKNTQPYVSAGSTTLGEINVFDPRPDSFSPGHYLPSDLSDVTASSDVVYDEYSEKKDRALGALLLLHPMDRLSVMLGLRWNEFESTRVDMFDRSVSLLTPARYKNHAYNKRVGLVYELVKDLNVYASYADGVLFSVSRSASGGTLAPETGVQWEVGAKAAFLDRKLTLSAAAFQIDRNNVVARDPAYPVESGFSITLDGQKHKGFEIETIGEPVPGWNIVGSYSYLDVSITDAPNPGMIGQQRANSPHDMIKLYSTYQLMNGPLRGLTLGGGLFYTGEREVDNFGSFQLPAYTRVDLRVGYDRFEHVSFSLNVINVTDEKIYTSFGSSTGGGIDYQARRTALFRVNFKY